MNAHIDLESFDNDLPPDIRREVEDSVSPTRESSTQLEAEAGDLSFKTAAPRYTLPLPYQPWGLNE